MDAEEGEAVKLCFTVPGRPACKQSFVYTANGGGYTKPHVKRWQTSVSWAAREAMGGDAPVAGPVRVTMRFVMPDKTRRDCDNLSKAVLDSLNGIVFVDDCQVVDLHITKEVNRAEAGVMIKVEEL